MSKPLIDFSIVQLKNFIMSRAVANWSSMLCAQRERSGSNSLHFLEAYIIVKPGCILIETKSFFNLYRSANTLAFVWKEKLKTVWLHFKWRRLNEQLPAVISSELIQLQGTKISSNLYQFSAVACFFISIIKLCLHDINRFSIQINFR